MHYAIFFPTLNKDFNNNTNNNNNNNNNKSRFQSMSSFVSENKSIFFWSIKQRLKF